MTEKDVYTLPIDPIPMNKLLKHLQLRAVAGLSIISLVIGVIATSLLYRSQAEQLETELLFQVELQTVVLESEISRLKNLTTQITSRSRIRQELEKYLRNEISLDFLNNFSSPKLADAMKLAPDMVGISRLDSNGSLLIQVGTPAPEQHWPKEFLSETVQLGLPWEVDGRQLLVLSAPVVNRQGNKVGIDLVTFDIQHIIDIIRKFTRHQQASGNVRIARPAPEGAMYIYRTDEASDIDIEQMINEEVKGVLAGEDKDLHQISSAEKSLIMTHREIGDTGWVLFFFDDTDNFFAPARIHATYIGVSVLILTLTSIILTLFLVRPLSTRISEETDTAHRLLQERDKLLSDIQLGETHLQSIMDNATAVIYIKDREGKFLLVNKHFEKLLQMSRNDVVGKSAYDIFPKEVADAFIASDKEVFEKAIPLEHDEQAPHEDGIHHYISIKFPLYDEAGAIYGVCGISTDITERKQAEKELEAHRDNLEEQVVIRTRKLEDLTHYNRTLFETTPIGLVLCDMGGKLIDINPAYLNIIGYTEAEAKTLSYWDITPHKYDADEKLKLESLEKTGLYGPYEKEYLHKDGHLIPVQLSGLIIEQDGKQYIWSSVEDNTERQKTELAMTEAKHKAEAAAQAKSEFLANMSHEIRTPLNAVLGLARMGKRGLSAEKTQEVFELISESGQNLFRVVNDILDFSKIEAGKLTLEKQSFNLLSSLKNTANLVKNQVEDKGLSFVLDIADDLPLWVKGDALRLEQILLNLLSNAIKFTEKGEITLRVVKHNNGLQFQVCDTGIGMSESQLAQLFKPFEQADSSTTRRYGGTGLGLSISFNLATMMGGDLQAKSHLGTGSEFFLNLELKPAKPVIEPHSKILATSDQRLQGINILAAEDIEVNRLVLDDILIHEGAHVSFAENGQQALDLLEEQGANTFDVVLMDIQMPVMDGHEAARYIRKLAPALPVIGLTAHVLATEKERCISSGMVDHIAKPVDIDVLVAAIQKQVSIWNRQPHPSTDKPAAEAENVKTSQQIPLEADDVIDWPAMQIRYQGRDVLIRKLLATTLRTHNDTPEKLRQAVSDKDIATLLSISHSLKGMAGYLEARELQMLAESTEKHIQQNGIDNIQTGITLADCMDKLLARLSDIMA